MMATIMERVIYSLPKFSSLPEPNEWMYICMSRPKSIHVRLSNNINDPIYSIVRDEVSGFKWIKIDPTKQLVSELLSMNTNLMRYGWDEKWQGETPVGFELVEEEMDYLTTEQLEKGKANGY